MKKPDHSAAARVARYHERLRKSGLVPVKVWVPAKLKHHIHALAIKLRKATS